MSRLEIITRTERRRTWSQADRDRILAECEVPGVTVQSVAERNDVAKSLIYHWRTARRKKLAIEGEPLSFISYGEVVARPAAGASGQADASAPGAGPSVPSYSTLERAQTPLHDLVRPHPGDRPGVIDITLPSGVQLVVDSFVNEKALARVLKVLKLTT